MDGCAHTLLVEEAGATAADQLKELLWFWVLLVGDRTLMLLMLIPMPGRDGCSGCEWDDADVAFMPVVVVEGVKGANALRALSGVIVLEAFGRVARGFERGAGEEGGGVDHENAGAGDAF